MYVVTEDVRVVRVFDGISDVTQNGTDPKQHRKSAEELITKFNPVGCFLDRRQNIGSVLLVIFFGLCGGEALVKSQPLK